MAGTLDSLLQDAASHPREMLDLRQQESLAARILDEWDQGTVPNAQQALAQYGSAFSWDKSIVIRFALREYEYRRGAGEAPDPESFCRGFPDYANSILPCLAAHEAIAPLVREVHWPQPGDEIARLRILQELGRGGFARVYLAREPDCGDRLVALKLAPEGADEAHLLGKLAHPNIVAIHGPKQDADWALSGVSMPYHGRATLCDVLDLAWSGQRPPSRGSIIFDAIAQRGHAARHQPPAQVSNPRLSKAPYAEGALWLALQLTRGLAFAHGQGILHLDLKPSNVLLTPAGEPMLLDFNLSIDQADPSGRIGGTLPYMSPEQIRVAALDEDETLGEASDIFSLGVLLYQVLYGRLPVEQLPGRVSTERQGRHLLGCYRKGRIETPRRRDITRSTRKLLRRCLEFDPARRFATADDLAAALESELTTVGRLKRRVSVNRGLVAGISAVLMASLATLLIWLALRAPYGVRQAEAGLAHYRQGQYALAIECLDRSLKENPQAAEVWYQRGRAYQKLDDNISAIRDYEAALKLREDPRYAACLAFCYGREDYHDIAIELSRKAIDCQFQTPAVYNNLGYVLGRSGKSEEAYDALSIAIELDPKCAPAYHNRAITALQRRATTPEYLRRGLADIRFAISESGPFVDRLELAAQLCAAQISGDPTMKQATFEYCRQAVLYGADPKRVKAELGFRALRANPMFQALTAPTKPLGTAVKASRLMDVAPSD